MSAAATWKRDARRLLDLLDSRFAPQVLLVRYEDLVSDSTREIERVIAHIGAESHDDTPGAADAGSRSDRFARYYSQEWMAKSCEAVDPSRIDAWKEHLSAEDLSIIEGRIGEELAAFGYPLLAPAAKIRRVKKAMDWTKYFLLMSERRMSRNLQTSRVKMMLYARQLMARSQPDTASSIPESGKPGEDGAGPKDEAAHEAGDVQSSRATAHPPHR
jgi:hypothetical protein